MLKMRALMLVAAAACLPSVAQAAVVTLTFEGIPDYTPVGNYYAGQGITFSPATLALVDADAGGSGNFANEPSPSTIMFFLDANNAILNYSTGFTTGFSFYYSSSTAATVSVYDGLDGTGNLLGSINLVAQHSDNCTGDPSGSYCNWTPIGVAFGGIAKSINFGGTANYTGYDNITFGSETPTPGIPEPGSWAMMIGGFALAGGVLRGRARKLRFA